MIKTFFKSKYAWARIGLYGFWAVLGAFAILLIAQYGYSISGAEAATEGGAATASEFIALVCGLYDSAGVLIGALVVLMIVWAGIIYGTSQGQSGGEGSGIGLAKSMIVAALSGAFLYVFGLVLLGSPCGARPDGGFLQDLLSQIGL